MLENFIPINRNIYKHWVYRDSQYFHVWFEMLLRARFSKEPSTKMIEGQIVEINYAEFVFGRNTWSKKIGISEQRLRTLVKKMIDDDMIELTSRFNKFSLYKIKNYEKYNHQGNQQESLSYKEFQKMPTSRTTNNQPAANQQLTSRVTTKEYSKESNKDNKDNNLKPSSQNKPKAYSEDNEYYQMAVYLHQKIMEHAAANNKAHLVQNAELQKWADEFRKIVELDKRDTLELKKVIDWCTGDSFWQLIILSPTNLRKQYVQIALKMDARPSTPNQQTAKQKKNQEEMDLLNQYHKEAEERERNGNS